MLENKWGLPGVKTTLLIGVSYNPSCKWICGPPCIIDVAGWKKSG